MYTNIVIIFQLKELEVIVQPVSDSVASHGFLKIGLNMLFNVACGIGSK